MGRTIAVAGLPRTLVARARSRAAALPGPGTLVGVGRLVGAGLLAASGGIHLDLYLTGYGHVPTIGPLFLLQAIVAFVLAVVVVVHGHVLAEAAGALLALSTLGGYVLALLVPLFGFREVSTGAGVASAVVEIPAAAVLGATVVLDLGWSIVPAQVVAPVVALPAALAVGLALVLGGAPPAGGSVVVRAVRVVRFGKVLASRAGATYYLLSTETHGRLRCGGACWAIWPPVLLGDGARPVARGAGVDGRLGQVRRAGGKEQVTYNGYPLYGYAGDAGPKGSAGEGVASFGGTWYLVRASARSSGATPVR